MIDDHAARGRGREGERGVRLETAREAPCIGRGIPKDVRDDGEAGGKQAGVILR